MTNEINQSSRFGDNGTMLFRPDRRIAASVRMRVAARCDSAPEAGQGYVLERWLRGTKLQARAAFDDPTINTHLTDDSPAPILLNDVALQDTRFVDIPPAVARAVTPEMLRESGDAGDPWRDLVDFCLSIDTGSEWIPDSVQLHVHKTDRKAPVSLQRPLAGVDCGRFPAAEVALRCLVRGSRRRRLEVH